MGDKPTKPPKATTTKRKAARQIVTVVDQMIELAEKAKQARNVLTGTESEDATPKHRTTDQPRNAVRRLYQAMDNVIAATESLEDARKDVERTLENRKLKS